MGKENSYEALASDDLLYAKSLYASMEKCKKFNGVAALCQQSAEKYLKAIMVNYMVEDEIPKSLLTSHNLRTILNYINKKYANENVNSKDIKWLGDFYFDVRYPGDNYIQISKEDAVECIRISEVVENWYNKIEKEESSKEQKWEQIKVSDLKPVENTDLLKDNNELKDTREF